MLNYEVIPLMRTMLRRQRIITPEQRSQHKFEISPDVADALMAEIRANIPGNPPITTHGQLLGFSAGGVKLTILPGGTNIIRVRRQSGGAE